MTQHKIVVSTPSYEIIDERDVPKRQPSRSGVSVSSLVKRVRGAVEGVYVAFAGGAMHRIEQIEDVRAERAFAFRRRKAERR